MKVEKVYTSAIGKLYKETQNNCDLDKIVTDIYTSIEFEIKTGQLLPITIDAEVIRGRSSKDLDYIEDQLKALGCVGEFLFEKKLGGKIEYILRDFL